MTKNIKNLTILFALLTLFSCESKINNINIHGTYKSSGTMGYEAIVDNGTITIYSVTPFDKSVYWYGTCESDKLDENNKLISKRLQTERERNNSIFDFGFGFDFDMGLGMNKSGAREKEILFTKDSLTFIYDMSGMDISQETLYKENSIKRKSNENDSNAEKADPNYVEPSKPLPHEIPRGQEVPTTERETDETKEIDVLTEGENL